MANPFKAFRKNRKAGLVFVTLMCMFSFIVLGAGTSLIPSCGGPQGDVAVETSLGSLSHTDLESMRTRRGLLNEVMARITGQPFFFGPTEKQAAFDAWLKAQKAKEMGIDVTDEAIKSLLATEGNPSALRQFLRALDIKDADRWDVFGAVGVVLKHYGLGEGQFFEALRTELLARRLDEMFGFHDLYRFSVEHAQYEAMRRQFGFAVSARPAPMDAPVTPPELKEHWDMQHRRVHAEVLAVPVKPFISQVEEPTDEQLKSFFEAHKHREPNPDSPEPGFKLEHLAQFQYFQIPQERFDAAARAALDAPPRAVVTAAEIRQRYEKEAAAAKKNENHRFRFNRDEWLRSLPPRDKEADEKEKQKQPEKSSPPSSPDGAEPPKAKPKGAALERSPNPGDDTVEPRTYPVAFQPDGKTAAPGEEAKKSESDQAKPKDAKADAKTPAGDAKAADKADKAAGKEAKHKTPERSLNLILDDLKIPQDIREGEAPLVKPLWQVENELRNELAKEHAQKDTERLAGYLKEPMAKYSEAWLKWDSQPRRKEENKPVNPLADPKQRRQRVHDAWDRLVKDKKAEWTKSLSDEKNRVEKEIKRLAEEAKLPLEEFGKRAEQTKNEAWLKLLEDQKRLVDVEKGVAEIFKAWLTALNKAGPLEAPSAGGMTHVAVRFETTDPGDTGLGLSMRDFAKRGYSLLPVGFSEDVTNRAMQQIYKAALFQPTSGSAFHPGRDEFLYWMINDRQSEVPVWEKGQGEDADPAAVPVDREIVRAKWKEVNGAREKAKQWAEQLAQQLRGQVNRDLIAEVQRYFGVSADGSPIELSEAERERMTVDLSGRSTYRIVREVYENGRRKVKKPPESRGARPPLEAPSLGYLDRDKAEREAERLAKAHPQAGTLVIVGKSAGTLYRYTQRVPVYRGVKAYFWKSDAAEGASTVTQGKPQLTLVAWPGLLDQQEFEVAPAAEGKMALLGKGEALRPFTASSILDSRNSQLSGVESPSGEFVGAAFDLKRGQFGVAFNRPRTMAYLIHVADFDYFINGREYPDDFSPDKPPATLFAGSSQQSLRELRYSAAPDVQELYDAWINALHAEYKVRARANAFAIRE